MHWQLLHSRAAATQCKAACSKNGVWAQEFRQKMAYVCVKPWVKIFYVFYLPPPLTSIT
jgi:hypothetical protein